MNAHEQALSAYRQALDAAERERRVEDERQIALAQERSDRIRRKFTTGVEVLTKWFPGTLWHTIDTGEEGYSSEMVVMENGSEPKDPLKIKIEYTFLDMNDPKAGYKTRLFCVEGIYNSGYFHWEGPEVKSAADVGRWLAYKESIK